VCLRTEYPKEGPNMLDILKYRLLPVLRQLSYNHLDNSKKSYAQCGEDLILQYLTMGLGMDTITYLDVGAHHPTHLSNTYLFYEKGSHGVCVEPDPSLFRELEKKRPRDTNLNCGVGVSAGKADFFILSSNTLNTFSKTDAERYRSYGEQRIKQIVEIELRTINEIIRNNFDKCPNLVSLDVEGMDYVVLESFDFTEYRPEIFCLETLTYTGDKSERKLTEIIDLMHTKGYFSYADTYINTIFVDSVAWDNRRS
jgi:FkbM family methyltransferase